MTESRRRLVLVQVVRFERQMVEAASLFFGFRLDWTPKGDPPPPEILFNNPSLTFLVVKQC